MGTTISSNDSTAYDLTVKKTTMNGYIASLTDNFVKTLSKREEVTAIEKESKMSINYAVPNNLFKRTIKKKPLPNLDRIDQANFPLDKKYTFPDAAGKGVNVFVVDTGINGKHSEFGNRAKDGGSFCDDGADCKKGDDGNGHGTHVASTATGENVGVAPLAIPIAIQVLDSQGKGSNVGVIKGLKAVLAQHTKSANKNSVVSMSLGGTFSQTVNDAVKALTTAGVHVVVAAGNDGADACKDSPSSELTALTVGALDDTSGKKDAVADFSNIGKCVDIFAPGFNIKAADAFNADGGLIVFSGTSQATPHVSGTIALIISKDGNTTPAKMATNLIGLSTKGLLGNAELKKSPNNILRVPAP